MGKLIFFSDPHLGLRRQAHCTLDSSRRLRATLYEAALAVTDLPGPKFCLGDLFDKPFNTEDTVAQGGEIAQRCSAVLGGNHDFAARGGQETSMSLISALAPCVNLVHPCMEGVKVAWMMSDGVRLALVPHHGTQALFEAALNEAERQAEGETRILCLHCNYALSLETTETTLNLTRDRARSLLSVFDYILIGHEHQAREEFGGRLHLLGNIHPTSFADVGDKFYWTFEKEEGLKKVPCWADGYVRCSWADLLEGKVPPTAEFLDITGTAPASDRPAISRALTGLWKSLPTLFMARNSVTFEGAGEVVKAGGAEKARTIPEQVEEGLKDSPLLPVWRRFLEEVRGPGG
jgi:hypothetical protein